MTESSGGEFRNPYAPLPQATPHVMPTNAPSSVEATGGYAGAPSAAADRSRAREEGAAAQPEQASARRRAAGARMRRRDPEQGHSGAQRATSSSVVTTPTAPTAAANDPWRDLVALRTATPPQPRQPVRVGAFTLREVLIVVLGLAQLAVGFISVSPGVYHPVIALGVLWVMIIAVPGLAVIFAVVRRCWAPQLRIGMFSVDAFIAAASVSALLGWLNVMTLGSVAWFGCLLAVGFVVIGLSGSLIPGLREDFTARPAALAHPSDRPLRPRAGERAVTGADAILVSASETARSLAGPVRAVTMFPASGPFRHPVPKVNGTDAPATSAPPSDGTTHVDHDLATAFGSASDDDGLGDDATRPTDSMRTVAPTADSAVEALAPAAGVDPQTAAEDDRAGSRSEAPAHRGFWILVPDVRIAVDPLGRPMFPVEPSAWTLALEDRGDRLLVRSADGRVGFLTDLTGVIRN